MPFSNYPTIECLEVASIAYVPHVNATPNNTYVTPLSGK